MNVKIFAVAAGIAIGAGIAPASADITTGGIFDKMDGPSYARSSNRSSLGANLSPKHSRQPKRTQTYSATKVSAAPMASRGVGPRPSRWCGWWMRTQLGGGSKFNVAWNWSKWGRPASAQVGAVVVWRHHVGIITGRAANGQWIVKSGNDGGKVRERARSVSGAVFRI